MHGNCWALAPQLQSLRATMKKLHATTEARHSLTDKYIKKEIIINWAKDPTIKINIKQQKNNTSKCSVTRVLESIRLQGRQRCWDALPSYDDPPGEHSHGQESKLTLRTVPPVQVFETELTHSELNGLRTCFVPCFIFTGLSKTLVSLPSRSTN